MYLCIHSFINVFFHLFMKKYIRTQEESTRAEKEPLDFEETFGRSKFFVIN